ncbi:BAG domain-containing protein Samui isoform X1 [Colias croceus]|uniref:BAG domain-containing protein Samui isoform X1 n=1 Tax=Colias crocea TaxID=72248 RepID=UPI001E279E9E|nr:BAG domain-containing protein Samui isoform X1 [Colias croceus]
MESPVVVDKPPEYHGSANERGFPFDEEEGSGAWSELAARHPDIAARLRQRPATWARKRRPSSQDATDDFGDSFGGFDRFPFDDIPPEFREHFPSHWNRRFGSREEQPPSPPQPQSPPQQTAATQTEQNPGPSQTEEEQQLPQYGLRNTVDLGQKSPADPSLVDGEDRTHRSMSAPPDNRSANSRMSGHPQEHSPQQEQSSNVRHIPIFVEGRDEPVINKNVDHGTHFGETKQTYVPPPPKPHVDREQYFADDTPHGFHHPPNFSRSFATPFNKGFRQGPQPFSQQKMYPQNAFARGASPQRSQSPKPQMHPEEHFVKVPVYHDQAAPPSKPQPKQPSPQPKQPSPQRATQSPPQHPAPPKTPPQAPPQAPPKPAANDPITMILSIQTDVLNLMTEVENFTGTKKDKKYIYLDEMLTRNLIKLDNIETDGKENIRQARKEAIKCIQKCIAVLEAKAEKGNATPQPQDVEMQAADEKAAEQESVQNGDVEMKEENKEVKEEAKVEQPAQEMPENTETANTEAAKPLEAENKPDADKSEPSAEPAATDNKQEPAKVDAESVKNETTQPQVADTRPKDTKTPEPETKPTEQKEAEKKSPKKVTKVVKKRDKSKDKNVKDAKETANQETAKDNKETEKINVDIEKDSNKQENVDKIETMQVDAKGDKETMEVDGAASQ